VIPNPFRVNHRDGALHTNPETIGFGPENQWLRPHQVQRFKPGFKKFPGFKSLRFRRTFWFGLISAKKNVPPERFKPERSFR